ncbi:MAG: response regulator [Proteobacteria bacterium]|nr:response regulator [Pseudomonadota bacterium]
MVTEDGKPVGVVRLSDIFSRFSQEIRDRAADLRASSVFKAIERSMQKATASQKPPKFLLVDDEKEFVLTLSERLETRDLDSVVAHDGEEALEIVRRESPDVVVLDLKMPGMDGLEVLRRVKSEKPTTGVIILTGHGSQAEEDEANRLGAFAYLNKPVDIDVLAQTMKDAYASTKKG